MRAELQGKRGKAWYDALRQVWANIRSDVLATEREWSQAEGKLTPVMIAALCLHFDMPWKSMCEFLEAERIIPTGMYDHLNAMGLNVGVILSKGREWLATRTVQP